MSDHECATCRGLHRELAEARVREANWKVALKGCLEDVGALEHERDEARAIASDLATRHEALIREWIDPDESAAMLDRIQFTVGRVKGWVNP